MASREWEHLLVRNTATTRPYKYPKEVRGGPKLSLPYRNRAIHGAKLQQDLAAVRAQITLLDQQRQAVGIQGDRGVYLELASEPGFELALKSLDQRERGKKKRHIELVAVREQGQATLATVFVPEGRLSVFENAVTNYLTKNTPPTPKSPAGKPKNQALIESISAVRRAVLDSFWTDDPAVFPQQGQAIWWEVWLRIGLDRARLFENFQTHATAQGLRLGSTRLNFPDRTVCLAYGTAAQMVLSVELLDIVGELRRAKEMASFFTEMKGTEQVQWALSAAASLGVPSPDAPAVCILDSGVTRAHPLIEPGLDESDMHTYDPAWGTADAANWRGHGTSMAGLALHGDLTDALSDPNPRELEHRLESVKVVPPGGFPENNRELYGAITQLSTGLPEIAAPSRRRVFALAVTTEDFRDLGSPSSWSAEVDRLSFGDDGAGQRLFMIAAGNIYDPEQWKLYPDSNDTEQVHDPGQSWNGLTVGACTDKVLLDTTKYPDWTPVALPGTLSPTSTTSVTWKTTWPRKPDLVLEGGNAARNPATGDVDLIDDLAVLTTHFRPSEKLFVPTGDTSAATAQAARLGAILMARYPKFWPETIRALLVHSAEWTPAMKAQVAGESPSTQHQLLLQRYGWGVPDFGRACLSASNVLTLVAQETLQPYGEPVKGAVPSKDMHVHKLPWPVEQLKELFDAQVRLRVTLSYFIEPNPARRGWKYRHRYSSHGLRFEVPRADESLADFHARMTKSAQDEIDGEPDFKGSEWTIRYHRGSLHSDWWEGSAADLASRGYVAVVPVGGWWKEQATANRWSTRVRYSLVVSIHVPEVGVDIYTPIAQQIETEIATSIMG